MRCDIDLKIARQFSRMTFDLPMNEFVKLLGCGLYRPKVYVHNIWLNNAFRPCPGSLAWPVEHLQTSYHRKHFCCAEGRPLHQ